MNFKADLHIHSCLSPCADITMVPSVVEKACLEKKLDIIAITDHNSFENLEVFQKKLKETLVLPAVELCSKEEVHVLGYFEDIDKVKKLCEVVRERLIKFPYDPELVGYQLVLGENEEFTDMIDDVFLGAPLLISLDELVGLICSLDGIAVYAHVERQFGVLYQLGVFPEDDRVKIVEARSKEGWLAAKKRGYEVISSSDAHMPDQIGCRFSYIDVGVLTTKEIINAMRSPEGRLKSIWDLER
ncbi:PHP domain-containing protein [Pseudothermotoga thermarum]|uniref:PHP domain protein n=1 Tax=Pseudothermotoga thermarum DSM 5069 TaxID=688269 RepID=F7YU62_9THEM|nr:PHP domain-containing protein [Pseudothermotoga thermarum]AEH50158.1 PHP domain protein [Pseudothermotoga thermarum DSM 5069]